MRQRSPIEILIDRACGITDEEAPAAYESITLRCSQCGREQKAPRDEWDPPGAVIVQARCPRCVGDGPDDVLYFAAGGEQILPKEA